jgi:hypothetical protein
MAMTPEQLAERLGAALPQQLKCVVLYGSAAAGDFLPGESNFNVLLLVEPLTVTELDALSGVISQWSRAGHGPPLVFTPKQLMDSADAFPIELLDIQQSRRVLWGADLLADLRVQPEHLRLQVERELTGKLLALRGRYLLSGGKGDAVRQLMSRSLSTFLVLFRAALRLYESEVPARKLDALRALAKHIDFDVSPLVRLFEEKQKPAESRGAPVSFEAYIGAIEAVASAVNLQSRSSRSDA